MDGMEIDKICFYRDGKVIASFNWFGSNNMYRRMTLPVEVKRAVKLNLERKDCFYLRSDDKDWTRAYNVYIHADLVELKSLGRQDYINDWKQTSTRETFEIKVFGEKRRMKLDENGKVAKNDKGDAVYETVTGEFVEKFDCNYEFHNTDEWERCKAMAKEWKKIAYMDFTPSAIHDLMQHYNISKKRKASK